MSLIGQFIGIAAVTSLLIVVINLLLRRKLREKYAFWWIFLGCFALLVAIFPGILEWAAGILGIGIPINLAFFVATVILFLIITQQSKELTLLEDRTRVLNEEIAIINEKISHLKKD